MRLSVEGAPGSQWIDPVALCDDWILARSSVYSSGFGSPCWPKVMVPNETESRLACAKLSVGNSTIFST
jgi:hypothetical protein